MSNDINIKVNEIDLPERLKRECDRHITTLESIKNKIDQGSEEVFADFQQLREDVNKTVWTALGD